MKNCWNRLSVFALTVAVCMTLAGCSGGSKSTPPATYSINGTISGLTASGLVLQDNGGDNLTVSANATSFTFATQVTSGGPYDVTVMTQPTGETCKVTGGSGTAIANVASIQITCATNHTLTIGGSVFGLVGTGLVLQDNAGDNLAVAPGSGSYDFPFDGTIPTGGVAYSITVYSNPTGEACTVANPIGSATATVTTVDVTCNPLASTTFTVGGTVSGLTGAGLILQNALGINNTDVLPVSGNGSFTFVDPIASGSAYNVAILTQPAGRSCAVSNGSGTVTANVTNVSVVCVGEWTWMGGSNTVPPYGGQSGVYGILGTAAAANIPGGRQQALSWTDANGNGWLFGGYGYDSVGGQGQLNDLWKYDPKLGEEGEWTWLGGSDIAPPSTTFGAGGASGVYGTQGTAAASNVPGGREQVVHWLDASGNLWLFGGEGIDANGLTGELNDLWKFDPTLGANGEWTWMGGSSSVLPNFGGPSGVYGELGKPSANNIPGGRYGAVSWTDAAGNFWLFGGNGIDSTGTLGYLNDLWKYTPSATGDTGQWTWMGGNTTVGNSGAQAGVYGTLGRAAATNIPGGRDAGVGWTDASGNFWIFGGLGADSAGNQGYLNDLWKYTPSASGDAGEWTWMAGSRTIPSPYTGQPGVYGSLGTAAATNVPGGRFSPVSWTDDAGNFWLFSGDGYDSLGLTGYLNDLWMYTPSKTGDTGEWTWMGGSSTVGRGGGQTGVYGTLGVPSTNIPGGRYGATSWIDASGSLWLFGGDGYDSSGNQGDLNDLWKYQP